MSFPAFESNLDDATEMFEEERNLPAQTGRVEITNEPPPPNDAMRRILADQELHDKVKDYMLERIKFSEDLMGRFYRRWGANEMRIQAFVYHPKNEEYLKQLNDDGNLPNNVRIVIPFGYAALHTIATHMLHMFTSDDPIFQVGNYKDEALKPSANMQTLIDFQSDYTGLVGTLWQHFQDIGMYGVGIIQNDWEVVEKMRTIRTIEGIQPTGGFGGPSVTHSRRLMTVYEGNKASPIDPFLFFPDPRVPMHKCNTAGEFVFWRNYESFFTLKEMELAGAFFGIDKASNMLPTNQGDSQSNRANLAKGIAQPGSEQHDSSIAYKGHPFRQVDQGTIKLIPKKLGIGDSEVPELWMVALINKDRVVQCEKFDSDHGMHPISVSEPTGFGYSFGSPGPADYVGPIQDQLSWLFNSHSENIRSFLNNAVVVDPSRIVMKDLRQRTGGQIIRLKESAIGSDVRTAIHQLELKDVTSSHIQDAQLLMELGYMLLAVNEATMGNPSSGSRETATGVRARAVAATNRLGAMGKIISVQCFRPLTEQWVDNTQQYMTDDFYQRVIGSRGMGFEENPFTEEVAGSYTYPITDGTMPLDPVMLSQVWKTILEAGAQLPDFANNYDIYGIFERAASLGGAKEIKSFRKQSQSPRQLPQGGANPQGAAGGLGQLLTNLGAARGV